MPDLSLITNKLDKVRTSVEINSRLVDNITKDIVTKFTQDLDTLLEKVKVCLQGANDVTIQEFEELALKIPTLLYWLAEGQESLGIRQDIAKLCKEEAYNKIYSAVSGTIKTRDTMATEETVADAVVHIAMTRAYKIIQSKSTAAYELLSAVKKILTRRIEEGNLPEN